ncbi:MAG: glycosyltransferase [Chthoniobacterales bacterium]
MTERPPMMSGLPSLHDFMPKFYRGGPVRLYLPLLYDLAALEKPKLIVTIGFDEGEAFFTLCQAVREKRIECRCIAIRRDEDQESEDAVWQAGRAYGEEFYGETAQFLAGAPVDLAKNFANDDVDLLLIDDCDSGSTVRQELAAWKSKLASGAIVVVHGLGLERDDAPRRAWVEFISRRAHAEFREGVGLGVALVGEPGGGQSLLQNQLFAGGRGLAEIYSLAAERIEAQARAARIERENAAFQTRQIWLDSVLGDRWKAQEIMDYQVRVISDWQDKFDSLHRDREKAQEIMDAQAEQLTAVRREVRNLKQQIKEQKRILREPKVERPISEKIVRELRRLPRNLRRIFLPETKTAPSKQTVSPPVVDPVERYAAWIREHEPDADGLEEQRRAARSWVTRPKVSLLLPVHNTPPTFLDEMLASVCGQTYDNWEVCLVDGGSDNSETLDMLKRWEAREPRFHVQYSPRNLGIAENTNRALDLATGDFVTCVDHDDLLAPFALYELARAIGEFAAGDIFYSDEDRWSETGQRIAPFFKPEWSPELLQSFMYLGHLTAYRRDLAATLGGFRKEFDLSQDYDFALRATEIAREIRHIPKVLYHWREHRRSGSLGGKPEARKTNLAALADAMQRRNLPAEIIEYPTANRARLKISRWPKVSIIIPTDSSERGRVCLTELARLSDYPDWELVLVTNSSLVASMKTISSNGRARFVEYDKPFNFSDKCNLGAQAASGERLIFFNDDVEPTQADWIQNLIESLENPEVGAVAPKMLYVTGKIQHAGLVSGVRGLIGTAFHERPADSTEHFNLAQSLRDVSALSAACLAMRREDFFRFKGFDTKNTPIANSDLDLCFKIREAGLRCVYTPFATLRHTGHVSIGQEEKKPPRRGRDKSTIFLLKRWADYATRDPYFTDNMRDWLFVDSPTPIRMSGPNQPAPIESSADLLFISHDFSLSGAPMMLLHAAVSCQENGFFVVVMSPEDGPLREKFEAAGIPIIIDPLIITGHASFAKFARDFDCVIANTIFSGPIIHALQKENPPVLWWMHETMVGEHYLRRDARLRLALPLADVVVAPSACAAAVYQPFRDSPVKCLPNAIPDLRMGRSASRDDTRLRFLVLGTIEPRKGQDIFVQALAWLPSPLNEAADFQMAGRLMDREFSARVKGLATAVKCLAIQDALNHRQAIELLEGVNVVVFPSRDEAMPTVTMLEAMSLGKAIISTTVGGATEFMTDGENGLLVAPEAAHALSQAIGRLIKHPALVPELGKNARATYEKYFTMERFGAAFHDLIMETLARSKTPRIAAIS